MKTYIQPGEKLTVTAPSDLASGDGVLIGSLFGVAEVDALTGESVVIVTEGVIQLPKASSQAWATGAKVYWDATNKVVTTTASGNTLIGCAAADAASADTVGNVRLNGTV